MDHVDPIERCVTYNEATHAWSTMPTPFWAGSLGHGYDHNTINVAGRAFYHHRYLSNQTYKCDLVAGPNCNSGQWSVAYNDPSGQIGCCPGEEFVPWRGSAGRLITYELFNSAGSQVREWDPTTGQITVLGTTPVTGNYGGIIVECTTGAPFLCYLGGEGTTLHTLNNNGAITASPSAPCAMHWNTSVSTVDPATGSLLTWCGNSLHQFNPTTNTWSQVSGATPPQQFVDQWSNGALLVPVPTYNVIVVIGSNYGTDDSTKKMWVYKHSAVASSPSDTQSPTAPTNLGATAVSSNQVNLTWSASSDNVGVTGYNVFRNGIQVGTASSTTYTDTGLSASTTYIYTVSAFDAGGNASAASSPASTMTLPASGGGGGSADSDFQARCSASGVIVCQGFDNVANFATPTFPNSGLYGGRTITGSQDTAIKASGNSSLRFTIPGGSTDSADFWYQDMGGGFAQGATFYVQFRQRFDTNMVNLGSAFGGGGWKQVLFHNHTAGSCANMEITTNNQSYRGFPGMYTECGAGDLTYFDGVDTVLEYSNVYPPGSNGIVRCYYNSGNPLALAVNKCMAYQANQWITYYYQITIGTWGAANSSIKAWMGYENQPLTQFMNRINFTLRKDSCADQPACDLGFNRVMLTPYDTGKDGRQHPTANTWYDELIVSTQPIQAPGGGGTSNPPPAAPSNLRVQ